MEKLVPLFRPTALLLMNNLYVPAMGGEWLWAVEIQTDVPR